MRKREHFISDLFLVECDIFRESPTGTNKLAEMSLQVLRKDALNVLILLTANINQF